MYRHFLPWTTKIPKSQISKIHIFAYGQIYNCSKGALTPNWDGVRTCVRACVRKSRWEKLFTPYLVVELSPGAEIWCVYVTSINNGNHILTFLGIDNNRNFQNSRFFCGNLTILNLSCIVFYFQINSNRYIRFPNCALIVKSKGIFQ